MNELLKNRLAEIESRAYYKWVEAGQPEKMSDYFWFEAEKEVEKEVEKYLLSHDSPPTEWSVLSNPDKIVVKKEKCLQK